MYIPPHSSVFLDIDGWRLIPLTRHLWLVMRWIYEAVMLPYLSPDGHHIVKFKYQHLLQWVEGSQAGKEAQNKQKSVENNGILVEILSLAELHASMHSPGADLIDFTPGLKFPYTRLVPPVQFGNKTALTPEIITPPTSSLNATTAPSEENPDLDLIYPFLNLNDDNSLPIPGPVAISTLLPTDLPSTDILPSSEERNSDTNIDSSTPSSPQHSSPLRSLALQRISPYSVNDPGQLMQRISHPDGPDNEELTRSIDNSSNVPCITNQQTFLTSPLSWLLELLTQINASVESLISQIEDELS